MKIVVIGTGYVGLVTGVCLAEVGHEVVCVDIDQTKINMLRKGKSPIYEPGLDELIQRNVAHDRLFFTTSLEEAIANANVAYIAVGTPEREDGSADLQHVCNAAQSLAKLINRPLVVIVKSTVPVGTCDMVEEIISKELQQRGVAQKYAVTVASNPEFLKEGVAIEDCMRPDRIIVGLKDPQSPEGIACTGTFWDLYGQFIRDDPARMLIMDRRSSELTKYGANAMLATRISFMNELSRLCESVGADIEKVRTGMGADPRIGKKFLYAGPGYGGSCFPKDVHALLKTGAQFGTDLSVLKAVHATNEAQKRFVSQKIIDRFAGNLKERRIAVWGLAFKPGTDDVREAPAITVIDALLAKGATVIAHDPKAEETFTKAFGTHERLQYVKDAYQALKQADALVLLTEWREYKHPNWEKAAQLMRQKIVFDLRNQYSFKQLQDSGYTYIAVGRPDSSRVKA